ncbi:unnamed protein product [Absidia cylindrospora]
MFDLSTTTRGILDTSTISTTAATHSAFRQQQQTPPTVTTAPLTRTSQFIRTQSANTIVPFRFGATDSKEHPTFNFGSTDTNMNTQQKQPTTLFETTYSDARVNAEVPLANTGNQQQQLQQRTLPNYLRSILRGANVPYFIIRIDDIRQSTLPPNVFTNDHTTKSTENDEDDTAFIPKGKGTIHASSTSKATTVDNFRARRTSSSSLDFSPARHAFGDKRTVLPGFLTATTSQTMENATRGRKRRTNDYETSGRRILFKSTSAPLTSTGIFGAERNGDYSNNNDTGFKIHRPYDTLNTDSTLNQPPTLPFRAVGAYPKSNATLVDPNSKKRNTIIPICMNEQHSPASSTSVNIFGFPPNMKSLVLEHFKQYGQIIDSNNSQYNENWMTLRYSTPDEARKALAANDMVLGSKCMVGVDLLISSSSSPSSSTSKSTPYSMQHCTQVIKNTNNGLSSSIPPTQDMPWFAQKAVNGMLGKLRRVFL